MKIIFTAFFSVFFIINITSQQKKSSYCVCEVKGVKKTIEQNDRKVILYSSYLDKKIFLKLINNTTDTIYLFKTYFDEDLNTSQYLYRYNKGVVNISFLPLLPYLYTKYSDRIILQDRIIKDYQAVYDFYKIPPFNEYSFTINSLDLLNQKKYIKDFDIYDLKKNKKFKKIGVKQGVDFKFKIQLAYYNNINTLCNPKSFYFDQLNFNNTAKKFKIIESNLDVNKTN